MTTVEVRVPATSANLGPGFDAFGIALDVYFTVRVESREGRRVVPTGEGADDLSTGDDNLVWRALVRYCRRFNTDTPDVTLHAHNAIPVERGMGSSAAAAVAGVALGRALTKAGGRGQDLIDLAAEFEGHPDNAAAAFLGGLVVCHDGTATQLDPTDRLRPVLCVPTIRQSTGAARGVLPEAIQLHQAAANGARAAVVLAGLAGAMAFDPNAMRDVLHEPARFEVMPASGELVHTLRAAGIAACLSGAGPSVLAITETDDRNAGRTATARTAGDRSAAYYQSALETIRAAAGRQFNLRMARWDRAGAMVSRRV
ncbi:MAG: homoserine kinase [Egibacteraceae bacterium]